MKSEIETYLNRVQLFQLQDAWKNQRFKKNYWFGFMCAISIFDEDRSLEVDQDLELLLDISDILSDTKVT